MNIINNAFMVISIILLASCQATPVELKKYRIDDKYVENEELCQVAKHKQDYIGKKLTLAGTYHTDFLHFDTINAKCKNGESDGLAVGFFAKTEKNNLILKQLESKYCGSNMSYCGTFISVTFRGVLNKHDDGIYFDVDEIIIDESSEIRPE